MIEVIRGFKRDIRYLTKLLINKKLLKRKEAGNYEYLYTKI